MVVVVVIQWPDLLSGCSAVIMVVVVVQWPDLLSSSNSSNSGGERKSQLERTPPLSDCSGT